jgi:antirestriction protein ArdC
MEAKMEKFDINNMVTDKIIESLEKGVVPWHKPWKGGLPCNFITKSEYQGINLFILAMSPYKSRYWLTYKQAEAKGGSVKKGEKGTPIVFWSPTQYKKLNKLTNEVEVQKGMILKYFTVFNIEQTQNIEIPEDTIVDFKPIEACEAVLKSYKTMPELTHGGDRAAYSPGLDRIMMPHKETFHSVEGYYGTLFHEMVHSTGHKSRLNRDLGGHFGSADYSFEELVAELGSGMLSAHAGIENKTLDNSAAYIASWIKKLSNDKKMIIKASGKSKKAVAMILGKDDTSAKVEE